MSHPTTVKVWSHDEVIAEMSPTYAAKQVADMRYDKLQEFLVALTAELEAQVVADQKRDRARLAGQILVAAQYLSSAAMFVEKAWELCRPHEEKESV